MKLKLFLIVATMISSNLLAQSPRLVLPYGHTFQIYSAAFNKEGDKIVTCSKDKTIKIWDTRSGYLLENINNEGETFSGVFSPDGKSVLVGTGIPDKKYHTYVTNPCDAELYNVATGKLIRSFKGHESFVVNAIFNHDGSKILTTSWDNSSIIWNTATGQILHRLKSRNVNVFTGHGSYSAAFNADETKVVTGGVSGESIVWDANTGDTLLVLKGHNQFARTAEFSPDGKKIITASLDSSAIVWDAVTGKGLFRLKLKGYCWGAHFSPDGTRILTVSDDDTPRVWDAATGEHLYSLLDPKVRVHYLRYGQDIITGQFSRDGRMILTTAFDSTAKIWDVRTGMLLHSLKGHTDQLCSASFSPNEQLVLTVSHDLTLKTWNTQTGQLVNSMQGHIDFAKTVSFSPDGKQILTGSARDAKVWNSGTLQLLLKLNDQRGFFHSATYSPDGKLIATSGIDGGVRAWESESGKLLYDIDTYSTGMHSLSFLSNSKYLFICCYNRQNIRFGDKPKEFDYDLFLKLYSIPEKKLIDSMTGFAQPIRAAFIRPFKKSVLVLCDAEAAVYDYDTWKFQLDLPHSENFLSYCEYSPDGRYIITASADNSAKIWDGDTGNLLKLLNKHTGPISTAKFSNDNKLIVTSSWDKTAKIWDASSGVDLRTLTGHTDVLTDASFSPDKKTVVTASEDKTFKIWDASTGALRCTLMAIDSADFIVQLPSGYYYGTKNAAKLLHYVTSDNKIISFEQLDIKYNRPDKILQALGYRDTALINSYYNAYKKRINKLHVDTVFFKDGLNVPQAGISNRNSIQYEQRKESLNVNVTAFDKSGIKEFNILINHIPFFGLKGISFKNRKRLDTSIVIRLSAGVNRIEVTALNQSGTANFKEPLFVNYQPEQKIDTILHFIGIGINHFFEPGNNLKWSINDIRSLAKAFKGKYGYNCIIDTLFDRDVTVENIRKLKLKLLKTNINDKVIVVYSGHGVLLNNDYYLSTYTMNFSSPQLKGLLYESLENILDDIPARKKLLLIDACHSGEIDRDQKSLSDAKYFEQMQQLFVNVGESTGTTIISAAAGSQETYEPDNGPNGVFTASILEVINQNQHIMLSNFKGNLKNALLSRTHNGQLTSYRNDVDLGDWQIW